MTKLDELIAETRELRQAPPAQRSYTDFLAMLFDDFHLTGIAFYSAHLSRHFFACMCLARDFRAHRFDHLEPRPTYPYKARP